MLARRFPPRSVPHRIRAWQCPGVVPWCTSLANLFTGWCCLSTDDISFVHKLYHRVQFLHPVPSFSLPPQFTELYKKWTNHPEPNWAMVRNQLSIDDGMQARIMKYENF